MGEFVHPRIYDIDLPFGKFKKVIRYHQDGRKNNNFQGGPQDGQGEVFQVFCRIIEIQDNPKDQKCKDIIKNSC